MELQFPGRATSLDQLRPGACFTVAGPDGPDLCLAVEHGGRRGALILNRRHADGRHLPLAHGLAVDADVLQLLGATLAPSRAMADLAFGRPGETLGAPALYLGDGVAYLVGREADGGPEARPWTFDVTSGAASAIDIAYLPRALRWRVMVPEAGGGLAPVFEAGPA